MTSEDARKKVLEPISPFFWPDLRTVISGFEYSTPVPIQNIIANSKAVAGVISPIDHLGCEWLRTMLEKRPEVEWKIVFAVYGGCQTRNRDLQNLHEIQVRFPEKVMFRIKPFKTATAATTSLALVEQSNEVTLAFGNSPNFGLGVEEEHHLNLIENLDPILLNQWRSWFDWIWENAAPLNENTVAIPALVPATGTPEAAALWGEYLVVLSTPDPKENWTVDQNTGEIIPKPNAEEETKTVTQEIGIPKSDPIAIRVAEVIKKGDLITVDKTSRIPPLETPIPPEWFGDKSQIQSGLISRRTQFRISPFDEKTLRDIENKRKAVTSLVSKFSYPLADGVRWIPKTAVDLFFSEIQRTNDEGKKLLQTEVKDGELVPDIKRFLDSRRPQIEEDARGIFQQVTGKADSSKIRIDEILTRMESRLDKALAGDLLPKFAFSHVDFSLKDEGNWHSPWGQAFSLIWHSAEFFRKLFSDTYFLRGLKVAQAEYIEVMNVCDDWIVTHADEIRVDKVALDELEALSIIKSSDGPVNQKCKATFALIDGEGTEAALENMADKEG